MRHLARISISLLLTALTGCGAWYGSKAQYDGGDWYGLTTAEEVDQIEARKLALQKLENQPVFSKASPAESINLSGVGTREGTVSQGYLGLVANFTGNEPVTLSVFGPEIRSWTLRRHEWKKGQYLIPGTYRLKVYYRGIVVGQRTFHVSSRTWEFYDDTVHWAIYSDY